MVSEMVMWRLEHCDCKRKQRVALCMIREMNASFDEALRVCVSDFKRI